MLTGIAWGFERSIIAAYKSRGIDLVVVRAGVSDQLSSNLDETLGEHDPGRAGGRGGGAAR